MEQDYVIKLYKDLCEVINNNPMPISMKYFVVKDFFNEVQMTYNEYFQHVESLTNQEEEKSESKKIEVPVEYTEEEIELLKKKK